MIRKKRNDANVERLRNTPPFADCSTRELRQVSALMTRLTKPAGTVLVQQGTRGRECFVIVSGQAVVERDGAIIGHAVAGSIVGELALMDEPYRTATVIAATDIELFVMSQPEFASIRALQIRSLDRHIEAAAAQHRAELARLAPPEPALAAAG